MRILHVITSLRTGGAEKLMVDLLPRFRAMGAEVDLALFDGTATSFRKEIDAKGIRVFNFANGGSVYDPRHILRLRRLMHRYDIVHTHNYAPQLFASIGSVLCSVVLCTTEHNTSNRRRQWKWYAHIDRWMYSRYCRVICISPKTESNLRQFIRSDVDKISTISNGIDVARYKNTAPSSLEGQCLPKNRVVLTQVARFGWEKDQDTTIRAMKRLPDSFHLLLVGDGPRRVECEKLAGELGIANRVHFLGVRTDAAALMKASDYVIVSSHVEGFGLVAVEGMAVGKPVLASDVDGLREVVEGAGILFPHQDAKALAHEILKLDSDAEYRNKISNLCAERAKIYDISTMAENYMNVYKNLLNLNGGRDS